MSDPSVLPRDSNARLVQVLDEYLAQAAQGNVPDKGALLARYPELADDLQACLCSLEFVGQAVEASGPMTAAEAAQPARRTLGDFQIVREVGRGGMGVVYEARQLSLGRRVALKVLPFAGMLDPRQLQRFKNEAQAAAQLEHPNIVDVISVGCERAVHFYAMRFIEGMTLAQVIKKLGRRAPGGKPQPAAGSQGELAEEDAAREGPAEVALASTIALSSAACRSVPPAPRPPVVSSTLVMAGLSTDAGPHSREFQRSAARLLADVAEALDYAHQVGVIHRDVKPSNILLDAHGKAWLTDFGLAQVEAGTQMTATGDVLGTFAYMSPEQATGQRQLLDHRTDVYSLGATLYELLALRPPFTSRDRAALVRQIAEEEPSRLVLRGRAVASELETIVFKALEKAPADRYATAGELADDLVRFLEDRPIRARRSRMLGYYAKRLWRRYQILFVAVLTTLLVAATVAGALVWQQSRTADEQRAQVVAREAELRQRLYAADIKHAHQAWQRGDVARAQELLDRYAGAGADDLREFAWHYLSSLLAARPAPLAVLRPGHRNVYCVQFSPDGRYLAAACDDGHVQLWNVADWSVHRSIAAHQADADCVGFSPDSKLLASGGEDGRLGLWDVTTGELLRSIDARQKDTLTVAISPDGQTLVSGGVDGMVRMWRLNDGYLLGEYRASNGRVQHLAFSPGGTKLATAGGDTQAMVVDAATRARLFRLPAQRMAAAFAVAFSADGKQLALGSGSGLVTLVDASQGNTECQFGISRAQVRAVAFSPTRRLLASAGLTGVVDLWDIPARSLSAKLYGHRQRIWSLSFSPDGKLLASASDDGSVHIWNPEVESGLLHVEHVQPIHDIKFAADGNRVLTADDTPELVTWDAVTLERLGGRDPPGAYPHELAFSPDRRKLALRTWEGQVWLGDTLDGGFTRFDPGLKAPVHELALARDGRLLVWYLDGTLEVWDTEAHTLLDQRRIGHAPGSWPAALSRDGPLAAICCDKFLFAYDAQALAPRFEHSSDGAAYYSVAVSPDNRTLAVGLADGSLAYFDASTGQRTSLVSGHQHWIDSLAFSPDGRTLATAGRGGYVRLWHVATHEECSPCGGSTRATTRT